jgi:hypothetical protein
MTTEIDVKGLPIIFRLDFEHARWHSLEQPEESAFPLIKVVNHKRYELYSDTTLAEVER